MGIMGGAGPRRALGQQGALEELGHLVNLTGALGDSFASLVSAAKLVE